MYKFLISRPVPSVALASAFCLTLASGALAADPAPAPVKAEAKTAEAEAAPEAKPEAEAAPAEGEAAPAEEAAPTEEAAPAPAAPTDEQRDAARLSFEAGSKAFAEGDFASAVAEFTKAYEVIPSPHAEYWIATALDKGDPEAAKAAETVAALDKFLSNPGAGHVGAEKVEEAKARSAELKKGLPASVTIVSTPEGAAVTINGEKQEGVTPLSVELKAGTYKVGLALEGYDAAEVEVVAEGGAAMEQQITLSETPVAAPATDEAAPVAATSEVETGSNLVPAAITLGLGGAGLISGTVFGIMALGAKSDFKDDPTSDNADKAERNALISDMSFGIALTLGITGIVLLTADEEPEAKATASAKNSLVVAPYASKKGGGAAARWTF